MRRLFQKWRGAKNADSPPIPVRESGVGERVGPYTLLRELGTGAFGKVWLAERSGVVKIQFALKVPFDQGDTVLEAVKREAQVWLRASGHQHVLPLTDAEVYDGVTVLASEFAEQGSLRHHLQQNDGAASSLGAAIELMRGTLAGLAHLHAVDILHRDLKPENILLQHGVPRLGDFGISAVLRENEHTSWAAGTPAYMAPEALAGKANRSSDLWSAGVVFYEMLTGIQPFQAADLQSLVHAICNTRPETLPFVIPKPLCDFVNRSLSKHPQERFRSAEDMLAALEKATPKDADALAAPLGPNHVDAAHNRWARNYRDAETRASGVSLINDPELLEVIALEDPSYQVRCAVAQRMCQMIRSPPKDDPRDHADYALRVLRHLARKDADDTVRSVARRYAKERFIDL